MPDATAGIFISYRREEANYLAGWLHDRLADDFGEARVFLDIDWIKPGADFMQVVKEAIGRSGVLLLVIGPQWLAPDPQGRRRLDESDDPVRVEIETALDLGVAIIPLLLDDTAMPRARDLPASLATITQLNALRVTYQSFRAETDRLVTLLEDELDIVARTAEQDVATPTDLRPARRRTRADDREDPVDVGRDTEQRTRLLTKVSRIYTEYLDQSVENDSVVKLRLELDWAPAETFRPQDEILAIPRRTAERLPPGTSLLRAFDRTGGVDGDGLLVLGQPGAGKTTLLFELARRLAERAQADPAHPVPVYLPLSTWAARRPRLDDWVVDQLENLYQVPHPLGRRWTADAQLLFVLDGLDEITDRTDRIACVKAINRFNRFGRSVRLPMMVASRPTEYETLSTKLQLETAVRVCSLDPEKVLDSLRDADSGLQPAVDAVQRDPGLLDLLRSPLLVSILTIAYAGVPRAQIHATSGTLVERRHQLITDYVNRRFELNQPNTDERARRRDIRSPERTRAWLSALASNLGRQQQTVFLPGHIQPEWLPGRWARWMIIAAPGLIFGVSLGLMLDLRFGLEFGLPAILGAAISACRVDHPRQAERVRWSWRRARPRLRAALVIGLALGLSAGLLDGLIEGAKGGLVSGLSSGLFVGLFAGVGAGMGAGLAGDPQPAERLSWSWRRAWSRMGMTVVAGVTAGLIVILVVAQVLLSEHASNDMGLIWRYSWLSGLGFGLGAGLISVLISGLGKSLILTYSTPYEGIRRSVRNGLVVSLTPGLIFGLSMGLVFGLSAGVSLGLDDAVSSGLNFGLPFGAFGGLSAGLDFVAQYGIFRLLLWRMHIAPLRYVQWLNSSVQLRLLYRSAGGGYVFIHRIVQDYFADFSDVHEEPTALRRSNRTPLDGGYKSV